MSFNTFPCTPVSSRSFGKAAATWASTLFTRLRSKMDVSPLTISRWTLACDIQSFRLYLAALSAFGSVSINNFASINFFLGVYGTNQSNIQRYLCCKSEKTARKAIWMNSLALIAINVTAAFVGLIMFAYYAGCDPLKGNSVFSIQQWPKKSCDPQFSIVRFFVSKIAQLTIVRNDCYCKYG